MPPVSWVSICNMALTRVGVSEQIQNLNADASASKTTIYCANNWENCRDSVLESWDWKCASARAQLNQSAATPVFGPEFSYPLPTQPYCLKVREMRPHIADYQIEGRNLVTCVDSTITPVYIRYTARVTDPTQLDALCTRAIAWLLAATIGPMLNKEKGLATALLQEYELIIQEAKTKNQVSDKDHNEDPGWAQWNGVYQNGVYVGVDNERLLQNSDSWVNAGTWIQTP
jgi:hypothetical protein